MAVKNNPDKFPEGYVRLRGCGKRKLCRIFLCQKNSNNHCFSKKYVQFCRVNVVYIGFYGKVQSSIFNILYGNF